MKNKAAGPLGAWIDKVSVNKIAQAFGLERSTIRKWREGSQIPKAFHMHAIVKMSKGAVSYADMIEPWAKRNPENVIDIKRL
jgi:hypothetical protein